MAVVLKWKADGQYLSRLVERHGGVEAEWKPERPRAMRFSSQAHLRRRLTEHFGYWPDWWDGQVSFVRLVPKRRAEQAARALCSDSAATISHTCDGVTLTAPATMSLGEVYDALRKFPALRVCFDAEVKRAVEEARGAGRAEAKAEIERLSGELDAATKALGWREEDIGEIVAVIGRSENETYVEAAQRVVAERDVGYRRGQEEMRERAAVIVAKYSSYASADVRSLPIANAPTDPIASKVESAGLSVEDVETLQSGGWAELFPGKWLDPNSPALLDPTNVRCREILRERAARIRAQKAPTASASEAPQ